MPSYPAPQPPFAPRPVERVSAAPDKQWLPPLPPNLGQQHSNGPSSSGTRSSLPPGARSASQRNAGAEQPASARRSTSASDLKASASSSKPKPKTPPTPPPQTTMKRSFFGIKTSSSKTSLATAGAAQGPSASQRATKSTLQKDPSTPAKTHTRRVSNSDLESNRTPPRSAANSGGARTRLSQSVGRQRPSRAAAPERDEWVVLSEPELRGAPGYQPPGTPTRLGNSQAATGAFASPSFYPASPPMSDGGHGRMEGQAQSQTHGKGHGQRQASGRSSYEDIARDIVGSAPPSHSPSHVMYPITPPPNRRNPSDVFAAESHRSAQGPPPTSMNYGRPPSSGSGSQDRSRTSSGSPTKHALPTRRDSLQQFSPSSSQRSSSHHQPMGYGSPTSPGQERLPTRRESLQAFQAQAYPAGPPLVAANFASHPPPVAAFNALPRSVSSGYSPLAAFMGTSPNPSSPSNSGPSQQSSRATFPDQYPSHSADDVARPPPQPQPQPQVQRGGSLARGATTESYSSRTIPGPSTQQDVRDALKGRHPPLEQPEREVAPPVPAKPAFEPQSNRSSVQSRPRESSVRSSVHGSEAATPVSARRTSSAASSIAPDPSMRSRTASEISTRGVNVAAVPSNGPRRSIVDFGPLEKRQSTAPLAILTDAPTVASPISSPLSSTVASSRSSHVASPSVIGQQILKLEQERSAADASSQSKRSSRNSAQALESPIRTVSSQARFEGEKPSEIVRVVETLPAVEEAVDMPIPQAAREEVKDQSLTSASAMAVPAAAYVAESLESEPTATSAPAVQDEGVERAVEKAVAGDEPTEAAQPEAVSEPEPEPRPRFEFALVAFPTTVLVSLLHNVSYRDFRALRLVSKTLKRALDNDAREIVLQRYLGPMGYRSFPSTKGVASRTRQPSGGQSATSAHGSAADVTLAATSPESIQLEFADLDAFRSGLRYSVRDFALLAKDHAKAPLPLETLVLIRSATRAYNRVVLRIREQTTVNLSKNPRRPIYYFYKLSATQPIYKTGRAPTLRVWVPTKTGWMDDGEVVEVEREIWRGGVWGHTKRGDVVHNVAVGDFGNEGKLISDGRFLRDFTFQFDLIGHLPFLDMLTFAPAYYHNVVASSTSNPVFYLGLGAFASQVREHLQLCDETVNISSPQGTYAVKRFVYRSVINIKPGLILGNSGGAGGKGPGGVEIVDSDWAGVLVLETDGTSENAAALLARCASKDPTPFRIVREKSRPGSLWLRPVNQNERVN